MTVPEVIAGYRIVKRLGEGGMGTVWAARDPALPRLVALKTIRGDKTTPEDLARFLREADAMARVKHPSVIGIHAFGELPGGAFLSMELIEGESLQERVRHQGPYTAHDAANLIGELADAVAAVHAAGILHRDLKPDNVMLRADGSPVLLDFGLAGDGSLESMTQTGTVLGTPQYMSPEQANGAKVVQLTPAVDVYGLGGLLYFALTGHPPHGGRSLGTLLLQALEGQIAPPRTLRPDLPAELEAICLRALALRPEARYPCAADLREDLDRFVAGSAMKRSRGRRPALLLASALVALGGAGLALGTRPGPAGDTIARATPTPADRSPTPSPAESQLQAAATSPPAPEQPEPRALAELLELAEPGPERLQAYLTLRRLRPVDPALGRAAGTVLAVRQVAPAVPGVSGDKQLPLGFADQTLLYLDGTRPHAWDLANPTRDPRPLRDRPALRPYHLAVSRRGAGWTFYLAGFRPRTQGSVYWADAETGGRAQDSPAQLEGLPQEVAREWAGKFTDALAPSPDGSRLALAHGHDVVVYAVPAFAEARRFGPHAAPVRRLAWSRDGRVLAWSTGEPDTIGPQNALHAWWPADDRRLPGRLLPDEAQPALIEGLAFDPGGQLLASFKQVLIRDALGTPRPLIGDDFAANVIRAADDAFSRLVCFGSRGLMAATHTRLDTEGQIQGWDLERGVQVSSLSLTQLGYEGGVRALSVNEELGLVVVGLAQGTLALIALPDLDGPALAGRTGR